MGQSHIEAFRDLKPSADELGEYHNPSHGPLGRELRAPFEMDDNMQNKFLASLMRTPKKITGSLVRSASLLETSPTSKSRYACAVQVPMCSLWLVLQSKFHNKFASIANIVVRL